MTLSNKSVDKNWCTFIENEAAVSQLSPKEDLSIVSFHGNLDVYTNGKLQWLTNILGTLVQCNELPVSYNLSLKKHRCPLKNALLSPVHPHPTFPRIAKLKLGKNCRCYFSTLFVEWGERIARWNCIHTRLLLWLCVKVPKVQICHKTFVHDCNFLLI